MLSLLLVIIAGIALMENRLIQSHLDCSALKTYAADLLCSQPTWMKYLPSNFSSQPQQLTSNRLSIVRLKSSIREITPPFLSSGWDVVDSKEVVFFFVQE